MGDRLPPARPRQGHHHCRVGVVQGQDLSQGHLEDRVVVEIHAVGRANRQGHMAAPKDGRFGEMMTIRGTGRS